MDWINYLKSLGFTKNELENITFKYTENGVPIIDIEKGVDKLKEVETKDNVSEAPEPKTEMPKSEVRPDYTFLKKPSGFEPISKEFEEPVCKCKTPTTTYDEPATKKSSSGITMISPNDFILNNYADEEMLGSKTSLTFTHFTPFDHLVVPGITDKQLVKVLLLRNKNNPDIKETLLDLLDLF